MRIPILVLACAPFALLLLAPTPARAHFYVDYPDAGSYPGPSPVPWWNQDSLGSPQKLGPCGDEDDTAQSGGGPTGVVTAFAPGETVTLQWTEVISHAGWFRVALAANRADFVDPFIVIDGNGNSADAGIENPPVAPVIADGLYQHPLGALKTWPPYTFTLPTTPCAKCTIQIIQVMLDHPSNLGNLPDGATNPDGFLYHHCIDISIGATDGGTSSGGSSGSGSSGSGSSSSGGTATDDAGGASGGSSSGASGGSGGETSGNGAAAPASGGCGCMTGSAPVSGGLLLSLLGVATLAKRRRGRRSA